MSPTTGSEDRQSLLPRSQDRSSLPHYGTHASESSDQDRPHEREDCEAEGDGVPNGSRDGDDDPDTSLDHGLRNIDLIVKLSGVYIGAFLTALDSTLVGTLIGPISASLGNQRLLGWLASSFFIATCVVQPVVGKVTDIYGRRPVILVANLVFALGNITCAVAPSESVLILGRVVAGFGAGSHGPITTVILSDMVPLRRRGVWQGTANVCFGIGSGLGGPLGGLLADTLGWRWAFAVQVPVTAVCLLLFVTLLPETVPANNGAERTESRRQKLARIDWAGSVSLLAALVSLLFALNAGGTSRSWSHPAIIGLIAASVLLFSAFVYIEARLAAEPILPLALFNNRTIVASCLTNWFCSMVRFGLLFYVPLLFQLQGYSITQTGLRLIPESVGTGIASIGAGVLMRATGRFREQGIVVVILQMIGVGLLATAQLDMPPWPPLIYLFLCGLGYSGMITTTLIAVIASTRQAWQAIATSASYLFRSTGSVLGVTLASAVFQNALEASLWKRLSIDDPYNKSEVAGYVDAVLTDLHHIDSLPQLLRLPARLAYLDALRLVFLTLLGPCAAGLASAALVRHHRLHKTLSRNDSG